MIQIGIECFLKDKDEHPIGAYGTGALAGYELAFDPGEHDILINFPSLPLAEGNYSVDIAAVRTNKEALVYADGAASFFVAESDPLGTGCNFLLGNGLCLDCTGH